MVQCHKCGKEIPTKESRHINKKPNERSGIEIIFETGCWRYCKSCYNKIKNNNKGE